MKKILIVEDEPFFTKMLHDGLGDKEFSVLEARDGEEGLKTALEKHPDLIILDVILPKMDGIAMLKKLRQDSWGKKAKVLLLTNVTDKEKVSQSLELEADGYLLKPDWEIKNIVSKIREHLNKHSKSDH